MEFEKAKTELQELGYSILANIYSENEVSEIFKCLEKSKPNSDKTQDNKDVFAIRQLINQVPELSKVLFNKNLIQLLNTLFDSHYFLTKAIYFDKPPKSNWFVSYHQDLSISVNKKVEVENYINWTFKKGQYGVQPPAKILEDTNTIRIHLDDTGANNGALKVIPKSHSKGIIRHDSKGWGLENEHTCNVNKGGVMLMKPLTLHSSNRTTNNKRRRVIHLEFNNQDLETPLNWLEKVKITN
ncbi:phytanoyl-CoA dioxygenase family protein [Seonamhaeicola sp. ML3]|uniref:phytanoyl-CoA dioxygenase family protein n=1 Tax=Seonamhaeicola sp. ML3 TaxID=2937786 RepID=UPI0020100ADE|nr:phytanoyl-CoA dioxygenase family protein [Seonamhaeicola sp. ML3]